MASHPALAQGSAKNAFAITPSDTTRLRAVALYIGGAGNVAVEMEGNANVVTFSGALVGTFLPITVTRVLATGTTATNIVGLV